MQSVKVKGQEGRVLGTRWIIGCVRPAEDGVLTCAWSVMYRPTFSQSLMLQCLMVGQAPWPLTHTAEPTGGDGEGGEEKK